MNLIFSIVAELGYLVEGERMGIIYLKVIYNKWN